MTEEEIEAKFDDFMSELMQDSGPEMWYFISNMLEFCAKVIKDSPATQAHMRDEDIARKIGDKH